MEQCSKHREREAVGRCLSCGKYLCDECVAQRKGGKLLCYDCAVKVTTDEFEGGEKRDRVIAAARRQQAGKTARKDARRGPKPFMMIVVIGVIVILLQGGVILTDYLLRKPGETSFIWSNLIEKRYKRDLCADNLHRLSAMVETYKKDHNGSVPPDPAGVVPAGDNAVLACPATNERYVYSVNGGSFELSCPSPGAHGLVFLSDKGGKLKWLKAEE